MLVDSDKCGEMTSDMSKCRLGMLSRATEPRAMLQNTRCEKLA